MGLQRPEPITPTEQLIDYLIEQVMAGNSNAATMLSAFQSGVHPLQVIDSNGDIFSMVVTVDPVTLVVSIAYYDADGNVQVPVAPTAYYYAPITGNVGGYTALLKITGAQLGVDGATYAAGDTLGDQSPIEITAARSVDGTGTLQSVTVQDLESQNSELVILIFDADPSATTFTDANALDVDPADLPKLIAFIKVEAADYVDFDNNSVAHIGELNKPFKCVGTDKLYVAVMSSGTPTYVADCLSVSLGISQN